MMKKNRRQINKNCHEGTKIELALATTPCAEADDKGIRAAV
jgi:hypothetical protein